MSLFSPYEVKIIADMIEHRTREYKDFSDVLKIGSLSERDLVVIHAAYAKLIAKLFDISASHMEETK